MNKESPWQHKITGYIYVEFITSTVCSACLSHFILEIFTSILVTFSLLKPILSSETLFSNAFRYVYASPNSKYD
jgi:hypothetical protein